MDLGMSARRLYNRAGWDCDEDILFVRLLDAAACRGAPRSLSSEPEVAACLQDISVRLTDWLGRDVTVWYLSRALARMQSKYENFKRFVKTRGVSYCTRRNKVFVNRTYWRSLEGRNES